MKIITLDFETFYAADYSLSKMTTQSYILDDRFKAHGAGIKINNGKTVWITGRLLLPVFKAIDWTDVSLVGHNLHFDGSILNWVYGIQPKRYIDTLGMSRAMLGQHLTRHGLTYVAQELLGSGKTEGLSQTMGVRDLSPQQEHILGEYCINDVEKTWGIFRKMAPHFPPKEFAALDWVTRTFVQPKLYLDRNLLIDYAEEVRQIKEDALRNAGLETRELLMSNPKYAAALEELGVVVPTKITAKGKVTFAFAKTDEGHKALLEHDDVRVQTLVAARLEAKSTIEETRAASYIDAAALGPWPVDYNYAGAKNTHRFSGGRGGGGNPTNLKRGGKLRDAIYAAEGKKLLVADLAQIECRLVLWLGMQMPRSNGGEREALDIMANNGDLYGHFGTLMYGYEVNKKDRPLERQVAKSAVLGLGFGMGPSRFFDYCKSSGIKIEPVLAESAVALYRNTYAGVKQLWAVLDKTMKSARFDGTSPEELRYPVQLTALPACKVVRDPICGHISLQSSSGLCLKYPDLDWDAEGEGTYRDGAARVKIFGGKFAENLVQHLARNILVDMLLKIDKVYPVVMSTYDELVMEVDDDDDSMALATEFVTSIMTTTPAEFPGLPLGVETGTAYRYGRAKN